MLKGKLVGILCGTLSVAVAGTTALTLALSGPREVMSLNTMSDKEAVAYGISNMFSSATSGMDTIKEIADTMVSNKAALSMGLQINEVEGGEEINGFGGNIAIMSDGDNQQYAIALDAVYGSIELFDAMLYMDETEIIASIPALFEGVLSIPYDDLVNDLNNSYIGSIMEDEGFDPDEYRAELEILMSELDSFSEAYEAEYDVEEFADELVDVINDSYFEAMKNISVTDAGMVTLNGGEYQSYKVNIPVRDLSYVIKDTLVYILESDLAQDMISDFSSYLSGASPYSDYDVYGDYSDYEDYSYTDMYSTDMASQLESLAPMLESYWGMIVPQVEAILGKEISFTIELSDTVELAGFEFCLSPNEDQSVNYTKENALSSELGFVLTGDYTGGANIGDYTLISLKGYEYGELSADVQFLSEFEENGDFVIEYTGSDNGESTGLLHVDGNFTENNPYFSLDINSFKMVDEYGDTTIDLSFNMAFEEIDGVEKPSASPKYNIWDMSEDDFMDLAGEITENIEAISDILN